MAAPVPEPPKPAFPDYVNLGLILDAPMLHQLQPAGVLETTVLSSLMPIPQKGVTTYTFRNQRDLVRSAFKNNKTDKVTDYHYVAVDPQEKIDAVEQQLAEAQAERKKAKDRALRAVLDERIAHLKELRKQLKARQRQGIVFQKLVRSEFHEVTKGLLGALEVSGETVYEYDGDNIVKSTSTVKTTAIPPRVDELVKDYRYDALGRLSEIEAFGLVTKITYDPFGRPLSSSCKFVAPDGSFTSVDRTDYTYAPPKSEPVMPSNALWKSLTVATSGPVKLDEPAGLDGPPAPKEAVAALASARDLPDLPAELPELPKPPKLPDLPKLPIPKGPDITRVEGTYVYV